MSNVISALINSTTGLSITKLLSSLKDLVPFIVLIVPLALGLFLLFRTLYDLLPGKW